MSDEQKQNAWGGRRPNQTGRPKGTFKPEGQRKQHQLRAYDDEWELVKRFNKIVRTHKEQCRQFLDSIKNS